MMKKLMFPVMVFATALFLHVEAPGGERVLLWAQNEAPAAKPTVNLTAEQRHIIKEIVLQDASVAKSVVDAKVSIGSPMPAGVIARPFPELVREKVSPIRSHNFFVTGGKVVVISPKDNTIADIIE